MILDHLSWQAQRLAFSIDFVLANYTQRVSNKGIFASSSQLENNDNVQVSISSSFLFELRMHAQILTFPTNWFLWEVVLQVTICNTREGKCPLQ